MENENSIEVRIQILFIDKKHFHFLLSLSLFQQSCYSRRVKHRFIFSRFLSFLTGVIFTSTILIVKGWAYCISSISNPRWHLKKKNCMSHVCCHSTNKNDHLLQDIFVAESSLLLDSKKIHDVLSFYWVFP